MSYRFTISQSEHRLERARLAVAFSLVILAVMLLVFTFSFRASSASQKENAASTKEVPAAFGSKDQPIALDEFVFKTSKH